MRSINFHRHDRDSFDCRRPRAAVAAGSLLLASSLACGTGSGGSDDGVDGGMVVSRPDGGVSDMAPGPERDLGPGGMDAGSGDTGGSPSTYSASIGPEGGRLTTPDGRIFLDVPAGALEEPVEITLAEVSGPASAAGTVANLGPDGLRFQTPATLGLAIDPSRIPAGVNAEDLVAAYLEDERWVSVLPTQVEAAEEALTAQVDHFSVVGVTALAGSTVRLTGGGDIDGVLENVVLDPSVPDYVVVAPEGPEDRIRGLVVNADVRIEPGVRIAFEANTNFFMQGSLDARGTESDPIILEGIAEDGEPAAGHWRGLTLASTDGIEGQNRLHHVLIRHAGGEYPRPAVYRGRDLISASLGTLGNSRPTELRDVVIEDGVGFGFDIMTYNRFAARLVEIQSMTIRRVGGVAMGIFPATAGGIGEVTIEDVEDPRILLRGGDAVDLTIPGLGIPFVVGMTPQEIADYEGLISRPTNAILVQNELVVQAGAIVEYKPSANIGFRTLDEDDVPRLRVEGTEADPVIVRPAEAEAQCQPFYVANDGDNLIRHADFQSCSSVVVVPTGTAIRMEDSVVRDSDCVVFRSSDNNTVELERVELVNTPSIECGDF